MDGLRCLWCHSTGSEAKETSAGFFKELDMASVDDIIAAGDENFFHACNDR